MKKQRGSSFKKILFAFFFLLIVISLPLAIIAADHQSKNTVAHAAVCQKMIIPAYFYPNPTTLWDQAIAAPTIVKIMIVNPASGPGTAIDSNYVSTIARLRTAGIKPVGYVTGSYANRNIADIKAEVDRWATMYGVTDIFIDEVTSDAGHVAYFAQLNTYIKSKNSNATVIINPGTIVDEGYTQVADIISIFEGNYSTYLSTQFPAWVQNYPSTKFLHLVYEIPDAQTMKAVLALSQQRNAGYVYVTDDHLTPGHPWDTLATYWPDELQALQASCTATTNTPTPQTQATTTPTTVPTNMPLPTGSRDRVSPSVTLTNPSNGAVVSRGKSLTISANATDNVRVTRVRFRVNGSTECNDYSAPYQCRWYVPSRRGGTYTITATAYDAANNTSSASIKVTSSK